MQDYFQGVTPEERWKNDMLNELRRNNELLEQHAQLLDKPDAAQRRGRANGQGKRNPQQQTE